MMNNGLPRSEWREKRNAVFERDGFECTECGKSESEAETLHAHHNLPILEGGSNDLENLRTLCKSCHFKFHAEERRKGTLEDLKDIYLRSEAPVFRSHEIAKRLDCSRAAARRKINELVEMGFLEKAGRGVYYRSDLDIESAHIADYEYIIVEGSFVKDGQYIGREDETRQCGKCGKWLTGKNPDRSLKEHRQRCSN